MVLFREAPVTGPTPKPLLTVGGVGFALKWFIGITRSGWEIGLAFQSTRPIAQYQDCGL